MSRIGSDPAICFGAYRLLLSRITVEAVVGRFRAGETVRQIAGDYDIPASDVEECLRWRLARKPFRPRKP